MHQGLQFCNIEFIVLQAPKKLVLHTNYTVLPFCVCRLKLLGSRHFLLFASLLYFLSLKLRFCAINFFGAFSKSFHFHFQFWLYLKIRGHMVIEDVNPLYKLFLVVLILVLILLPSTDPRNFWCRLPSGKGLYSIYDLSSCVLWIPPTIQTSNPCYFMCFFTFTFWRLWNHV